MKRSVYGLLVCLPLLCSAQLGINVTDASGQPVADAVIYAEALSGKPPKGKLVATIDQIDKEFVPLVTVVQTGTAIRFPNKDNIRHNIYSFSPAKVFDLKLYSGTPAAPIVFDKAGQVVLGCNIHDWMVAYLLVVDTPWFDKSDAKGLASLVGLPTGDYLLRVWHPYQSTEAPAQKIKVGSGAESRFVFRLKLAPPTTGTHAK